MKANLESRLHRFPAVATELASAASGELEQLIIARGEELSAAHVDLWLRSGDRLERAAVNGSGRATSRDDALAGLYDGQAALLLPMTAGDLAMGHLAFVFEARHVTGEHERTLLEGFAGLAGQALSRVSASELSRALQTRDELLSIASHELNTPLTAVQLNLQSLLRKLSRPGAEPLQPEKVIEGLKPTVAQLDRLSRLLTQLLDVSRIQTGRMFLDLEAFDLSEAVRDVVGRLSELAATRGAKLVLTECEPVIGYWDRLRIEQVLSNLVSNALKYGEKHPIQVWLKRRTGDLVELGVRDEGIGISAEDLPRIFNRFERATLKRQAESFGLGLYVSNQIARAHGGVIEVESRVGDGSTFKLLLPTHRVFDEGGEESS